MKQLMSAPTLRFRRRPEENPTSTEEVEESVSPLAWTGGAARLTSAISWALIASLIAGPLALLGVGWVIYTASTTPVAAPIVATDSAETVDQRAAVEAFAEDFTITWLTSPHGQEKRLAHFISDYSSVALPAAPWSATDPATAGITQTEDGSWSVTVAASVAGANQAAIRRYFQVAVIDVDGALAATALPTPVAGPQLAVDVRLGYRYRAATTDPVAVAAGEFLNAMLAGAGDVTRFITPGAQIRAIVPAPYASVELGDVRVDQDRMNAATQPETGQQLHLLAEATATVSRDQQITVAYALTMTARAGRWEVTAIDQAPLLAPADPAASAAPSASTSPSTTTN